MTGGDQTQAAALPSAAGRRPGQLHAARALSIGVIALVILQVFFSVNTATNGLCFPLFVVSTIVCYVVPGAMLVQLTGLLLAPIEQLVVATCLGMAATVVLYAVLTWLGAPGALWAWMLAGLWRAWPARRSLGIKRPEISAEHVLLLFALVAAWLPILLIHFYGRNLAWTDDGGMLHFDNPPDVALHTAIAGELTHSFPPQIPQAAGLPLSYHVGMDLAAAVLARFGGLSIPDLVVRLCPLLFVTIDVLAVFCLGRRLTGSGKAGAAIAFLTMFGEDFSFLPGLAFGHLAYSSAYYAQVPTIFSLYDANPMVMGLGFLFTGLLCLHRSMADGRLGGLLAACACLAVLIEIKVFLFVQLAIAVAAASAIHLAVNRRLVHVPFGLGLLVAGLPLLLMIHWTNAGAADVVWTAASGLDTYVRTAVERMHLPALAAHPAIALPLYLVCALGFRLVGAGPLLRAFGPSHIGTVAGLLAVFTVVGPILTLTTAVLPRGAPATYDNAVWFFGASKFVAPTFAVAALVRCWESGGRRRRALMVALVAMASLPSSVLYVAKGAIAGVPTKWTAGQMVAITALNHLASPGQVVLPATIGFDRLIMTMTTLRLPYADFPFMETLVGRDIAAARQADVALFRRSWAEDAVDEDVLARYRVDWIIAAHRDGAPASTVQLERVFDDGAVALYRVRRPASQASIPSGDGTR